MSRAIVLGSTGMLGSAVLRQLKNQQIEVTEASRSSGVRFDAEKIEIRELLDGAAITASDVVINCVGLTKSRIDDSSRSSRAKAVKLNVDFPNHLAQAAESVGFRIIQVATDCVFSGLSGNYTERSPHDAFDVYGKTKSLGEVPSEAVMHLRCSLIGPEQGRNSLFFEWVRQQPQGARINGYTNHLWNGLTSDAFGKVVAALVRTNTFTPGIQHLVPRDSVTKSELVQMVLGALGRNDVEVVPTAAEYPVNRTLSTVQSEANSGCFALAGYSNVPTIEQMVTEMCSELAD